MDRAASSSAGQVEHARVQHRALGEGRAQRAVQAVLEVQVAAPLHDVGEQVAEVRRVLGEQRLEVQLALGGDQLFQAHLGRRELAPLALAVARGRGTACGRRPP